VEALDRRFLGRVRPEVQQLGDPALLETVDPQARRQGRVDLRSPGRQRPLDLVGRGFIGKGDEKRPAPGVTAALE